MKIVAVNGGPRKKWNTATLLGKAVEGACSKGAEVSLHHVYDINFKGCVSCFACKRRDAAEPGMCAYKDELTPLLREIAVCDALLLASPIYLGSVTGEMASFLERLVYMALSYDKDSRTRFAGKVHFAFIYTMGLPARMAGDYQAMFDRHQQYLGLLNGTGDYMVAANTYQFSEYSKYCASSIDAARKAKHRDEYFPLDCEKAFALGEKLASRL